MSIIIAIILFLSLITIHEFGHFIVAKKCNIKVNEFSVGMGPHIWKKQKGETLYSIRALPLGGYCAMEGEDSESEDERSFDRAKPFHRFLVIIAGAGMNIIVAFISFFLYSLIMGNAVTTVDKVQIDSPAYKAGIKEGDKIISYDNKKVDFYLELSNLIAKTDKDEVNLDVFRHNEVLHLKVEPKYNENIKEQKIRYIGITPKIQHDVISSLKYSWDTSSYSFKLMADFLSRLFKGKVDKDEISGPIAVIDILSKAASSQMVSVLFILGLISISLAFFNLLPIPALDGGKAVLILIEMITKKRISKKLEERLTIIGFSLFILLLLYVSYNDIWRIINK